MCFGFVNIVHAFVYIGVDQTCIWISSSFIWFSLCFICVFQIVSQCLYFLQKKSVFSRFITSLVVLFSYCVYVVFSMFVMINWWSQCFFEKKFDVLCFNFHSAFMLLSPCLYGYSIVSQCLDVLTGFLYGYNVFDVFLNVHFCCFTWFVNSYMFLKLFSQCV